MSDVSVPNPNTPLAFLPPALATQFEVSRYLYAITLGGYLWDFGINLGNDYKLLFKSKIRFPTVVYYLSRIFTMAYIITSFVFQVGHVPNCQALQYALGICNTLSQTFTSLLFLLRVTAVWHGNQPVRALYVLLWLGVVGCSITVPVGISGAHIGRTQQCINTRVEAYTEATAIMDLINDTFIFAGITYRIMSYSVIEDSFSTRAKTFFGGGRISALSRALLLGGQHYYLIALLGNIILLVLLKLPTVPPVYQAMCTIPILALINAMACIVFRKIKFGLISHDGTTKPVITDGSGTISVLPAHYYRRRHDGGVGTTEVVIDKDTKVTSDGGIAIPLRTRMTSDSATVDMDGTKKGTHFGSDKDSVGQN